MSSRYEYFVTALLALGLMACSTDPEIDWERLEEYVLVTGRLETIPCPQDKKYCWGIQVQRLRPIIGYAFDPEGDQTFFISGAQVTVSDSDSTYIFGEEEPIKNYIWRGDESFVRFGRWYRLEVLLPDGHLIYAEIVTPKVWFVEGADTIWIQPDSITAWSTEPWIVKPIAFTGPHYKHTIKYRATPGAVLDLHTRLGIWEEWLSSDSPFISDNLYRKIEVTDSTIIIYTAVESPTSFSRQFEPVVVEKEYWDVEHELDQELREMGRDDFWPIENLEEISNIAGAYGIFTANQYELDYTYVLALQP